MHSHYDYLIIGSGIAGVTAAETIREHTNDAHIAIVGEETHTLYSRVLLPAYLKSRIPRSKLFLRTIQDITDKKIDMHGGDPVVSVDVAHKDVTLESGKTFAYGKLLLATGGRVKEWGRPEDQSYIYRLQTLDDADRLFAALPSIHNPLVIGSSFISLEFLEIFLVNKITPTLLVRDKHFFGNLLEEQGSKLMHENFLRLNIKVNYNDTIARIDTAQAGTEVTTKRLEKISTDAIAVGIGIDRNCSYAKQSGIEIGEQGIKVNEFLETNSPDIFAAGDAAEYYDIITKSHRTVGNWTGAVLQGKHAGLGMVGIRKPFMHVPSYSITNLGFQITALGDTTNDDGAVVRIDTVQKQYERFFLRGNVLAGAVLINRFADKAHLSKLIEQQIDIAQWRDQLSSTSFDIHTIPVIV